MRIIAGAWGGRRLPSAPPGVRPSSDRVKEALFSMMSPRLAEARVLDLYAGTGALGLEALSRGAAHATFVERAPKSLAAIERNLAELRVLPAQYRVIRGDALAFLAEVEGETFDIVLVDPPYAEVEQVGPRLEGRSLAADGRLTLEHDKRARVRVAASLAPIEVRSYGDTCLSVFTRG